LPRKKYESRRRLKNIHKPVVNNKFLGNPIHINMDLMLIHGTDR
jgi:hypothetical protein